MTKLALFAAMALCPLGATTGPIGDWIEKVMHTQVNVDPAETRCLARVIYHETRGETIRGKYAVAQVALNRTTHPEFPDTVCKVIRARNAFPWAASNTTPYKSALFAEAERLAREIMVFQQTGIEWGPDKTKNSLFFNTVPFPYKRLKYDGKIGGHLFYSLKD